MTSYIFIRAPLRGFEYQNFKRIINNKSIFNSKKELKEGIIPEKYGKTRHSLYFQYGFECEYVYPTLSTDKKVKILQKVNVLLIINKFIAIGYGTKYSKETESKTLEFIQRNILNNILLEPLVLEEEGLRHIINRINKISGIDLTPKGRKTPHNIRADAGNILDTNFWEAYGDQPLKRVRLVLSEIPEDARIGFGKNGIITLYNRSFTIKEDTTVLEYIIGKVIAPYVKKTFKGFQKTL